MLIKRPDDIKSSEVTDKSVYLNRRNFMRGAALAATTAAPGFCPQAQPASTANAPRRQTCRCRQTRAGRGAARGFSTDEKPTSLEDITNYNNFYEFSTDKRGVAEAGKASSHDPGASRSRD